MVKSYKKFPAASLMPVPPHGPNSRGRETCSWSQNSRQSDEVQLLGFEGLPRMCVERSIQRLITKSLQELVISCSFPSISILGLPLAVLFRL